jgi:hypothetical protein
MDARICIVVPSYANPAHIELTLSRLAKLGFFAHPLFLVLLVENPYKGSCMYAPIAEKYKHYPSFVYESNTAQLQLHGSIHKALQMSIEMSCEWCLVLGDDDDLLLPPSSVLKHIGEAELYGAGYLVFDTVNAQLRSNYSIPLTLYDHQRLNKPDLHFAFGYISNIVFRLSSSILELSEVLINSGFSASGHHFFLHTYNCYLHHEHILAVPVPLVREARSILFVSGNCYADRYSLSGHYLEAPAKNYNFLIWSKVLKDSFAINHLVDLPDRVTLSMCDVVAKSYKEWLTQSTLYGIRHLLFFSWKSLYHDSYKIVLLLLLAPRICFSYLVHLIYSFSRNDH